MKALKRCLQILVIGLRKAILAIILCLRPDGMMEAVANDECGFNIGLTSWMTTMDDTYGEGTSDKLELIPYYIERTILFICLLAANCMQVKPVKI